MKERFLKWLRYVPVFVLMLFICVSLNVRASEPFSFRIDSYTLPAVFVSNGYEYSYTVSNPGTFDTSVASGYGRFLLYLSPNLTYPAGNYSITLDNVRLMYNGQIFYASYISSGTGGLYVFDFSTTVTNNQHCSLLADVHFWGTSVQTVSGVSLGWNVSLQSFEKIDNPDMIQQTSDKAVLEESKKQTDALTKFDKADDMASDSAKADSAVSDFKDSESAVISGAQDGLNKFDFLGIFTFPVALTQSLMLVSQWTSAIINGMGAFSLIFSLGSALSICLMFIGLWKFKGDK